MRILLSLLPILAVSFPANATNPDNHSRLQNLIKSAELTQISSQAAQKNFYLAKATVSKDQIFDGSTTYDITYKSSSDFSYCTATLRVGGFDDKGLENQTVSLFASDCLNTWK